MTAISKFQPVEAVKCPVCLEEGTEGEWYSHAGGGEAHPIHAECLKPWFQQGNYTCPSCRMELDPAPLAERVQKSAHVVQKQNEAFAAFLFLHLFAHALRSRMIRQMESSHFFQPHIFVPRIRHEMIIVI